MPMLLDNTTQEVSITHAQVLAAELANAAAGDVLRSLPPDAMIAPACIAFRKHYELLLRTALPGVQSRRL